MTRRRVLAVLLIAACERYVYMPSPRQLLQDIQDLRTI